MPRHQSTVSPAEKQRLYRARRDADPVRRAKYLQSEQNAWVHRREKGKWLPMDQLSARSQRSRKRKNCEAQERYRKKRKLNETVTSTIPPQTPSAMTSPASLATPPSVSTPAPSTSAQPSTSHSASSTHISRSVM